MSVPIATRGSSDIKIVEIRKAALFSSSRPAVQTLQARASIGETTIDHARAATRNPFALRSVKLQIQPDILPSSA